MGSIGPNNYLPGDVVESSKIGRGLMCESHPDRVATHCLIGETDSFGSETQEMCHDCHLEYLQKKETESQEYSLIQCDNCNSDEDVRPTRDPDEGMCGPVYYRCKACRKESAEYYSERDDDYYR